MRKAEVQFSSKAIAIIHDAFRPSVAGCQSGLVRCSKGSLVARAEREERGRVVAGIKESGGCRHAERECIQ